MIAGRWIDEYTVISAANLGGLESQVATHLRNMWQPYGPLIVTNDAGVMTYLQTMVRFR